MAQEPWNPTEHMECVSLAREPRIPTEKHGMLIVGPGIQDSDREMWCCSLSQEPGNPTEKPVVLIDGPGSREPDTEHMECVSLARESGARTEKV